MHAANSTSSGGNNGGTGAPSGGPSSGPGGGTSSQQEGENKSDNNEVSTTVQTKEFDYDVDPRNLNDEQREIRKSELNEELNNQLYRAAHAETIGERENAIDNVNKILEESSKLEKAKKDKTFIRNKIAEAAKSLEGSKFQLGEESLGLTDCSGTVYFSYTEAGIAIGRLDAQGYHDKMTEISKENLKPGDIITYLNQNTGEVTHVQVYIGKAVETKTGKEVNDAVINAGSPDTGVYIVSLGRYQSWEQTSHLTPAYGSLLQ
ncbi:MAG: C40 family peptidase [Firmicutes bacterium]|nr:C40 family peptidase [Bacillota bacterium]